MKNGKVYLVGAGPGDPGLLTLRAKEVLSRADAVLYDSLVHDRILDFIPTRAEKIFRGSRGKKGSMSQDGISRLLIRLAKTGKTVVRLKGGDPYVFGRGAEEGLALHKAGVPFEVVPGVSSAVAVPAYAGIPVTHREYNSSFTVVTGHEDPSKDLAQVDWGNLAQNSGTLVFLMGLHTLPRVCSKLISEGKDPETPAAAIQWGTTPRQKSVLGTLRTLPSLVRKAGLVPPSSVVVGKVVCLAKDLDWVSRKPLWGMSALVTRGRSQANFLTELLEGQGAEVLEIPTLEVRPLSAGREAVRYLAVPYDWIVFSSVNAVECLAKTVQISQWNRSSWRFSKVACVGGATAAAARALGIPVNLVPKDYKQEGLVRAFKRGSVKGKKFLLAQAKQGRLILEKHLKNNGAKVDCWALYENRVPPGTREKLIRVFSREDRVNLLTFASSSAVDHFYGLLTRAQRKLAEKIQVAAIGPVTAASARKWGARKVLQPNRSTIADLVSAIVKWAKKRPISG